MKEKLSGLHNTLTALITPFDADGEIDLPCLKKLVKRQLDAGVGGLVACGTTAETPCLSEAERELVIKTVIETVDGKVPVIAGSGSNDTRRTVEETERVMRWGADAALVVTPYYNKPTQAGMLAHYQRVSEATGAPIIAYNVPSRTGSDLLPETLGALFEAQAIIGVKDATGSMQRATEIMIAVNAPREDFLMFSGDDFTMMPFIAIGGRGLISVVSNIAPKTTSWLLRLSRAGMFPEAWPVSKAMTRFVGALFKGPNPVPVKAAMALAGLCSPVMRLPLVAADDAMNAFLKAEIEIFKEAVGSADFAEMNDD